MQIPVNFSAAQATSIASQISARDKMASEFAATPETAQIQSQLEKSQSSSPDRDAQGQGDGLGPHHRQRDENEVASDASTSVTNSEHGEPPPLMDVIC